MKLQKLVIVAVWFNVTQTKGWTTVMLKDAQWLASEHWEDATVLQTSESPFNNHEDAFTYDLLHDLNM